MLTNYGDVAEEVADDAAGPSRELLSLHRRFELLVAALAIGVVSILAVDAEPEAAQSAILVAGPALRSFRGGLPSRRGASFLQRKIRCTSVSSRLHDEG